MVLHCSKNSDSPTQSKICFDSEKRIWISSKKDSMDETIDLSCVLCTKTEKDIDLIEMESNSLKSGEEIIEFSDLFDEVFGTKVNKSLFLLRF